MDRTNYFGGFDSKPAHYEDNLTRAFLALLRLVPPVQAAFIDAVREVQLERGDRSVVPPRTEPGADLRGVWTQTGALHAGEGRLLSILLSSEDWEAEAPVGASDRGAVYDGVIHYGEGWILVVENKPYGDVREAQLSPNLGNAEGIEVEPRPVVVVWEGLIARLHGLLEGGWLGATQTLLVGDFLSYVKSEFKWLNPYPTLAACGNDLALLNHRCVAIMEELAPGRVDYHQGWRHYMRVPELEAARYVALSVEETAGEDGAGWGLVLEIHPGDTVSQARSFYRSVDVTALGPLLESWSGSSNLHFSHINKHLHWCRARKRVVPFVTFWLEHQGWIRNVKEEEFAELSALLDQHGLTDGHDRREFERLFVDSKRSSVNVCPGISLTYRWTGAEAVRLDREGRLVTGVEERIRQAVRTWGAEGAWSAVRATARSALNAHE